MYRSDDYKGHKWGEQYLHVIGSTAIKHELDFILDEGNKSK